MSIDRRRTPVKRLHAYTLDAAGRRIKATREDGADWHYGYNERDEKRRGIGGVLDGAPAKPDGQGPQAGGPSQFTSAVKRLPNDDPLAGWQQEFAYDSLGNRTWAREGGDENGANLRQTDYTANALNQYTQITRPGAFDVLGKAPTEVAVTVNDLPVVRQGEFWRAELDGLPNALAALWQSVSVDALDPGAGPGGADLPAHRFGHRFVPPALETPLYDSDGNLVSDARWTYAWDAENRLVEVQTGPAALAAGVPGERYRYAYDSRTRRIGRTVERWNPDTQAWVPVKSERFVHDDWNVVAVVDAAGDLVQRYAWGNDLSGTPQTAGGVGGLLAAWDAVGNRAWCYAYDGNGNVSAVVDLADGTKVGRYDYDAFGRTIAQWGDEELCEANVYRFSTKPLDGTGLYYYGFRYYNPETGRWPSRDPIEEQGGVNLYGFVGNDGVNGWDRLGMYPGSPGHGQIESPPNAVQLLKRIVIDADRKLEARLRPRWHTFNESSAINAWRSPYRLVELSQQIGHASNNKFIYTCKYGWIDMGHYINNALIAYWYNVKFAEVLSYLNEVAQGVRGTDSAWTPEDLTSNHLGRQFAKRIEDYEGYNPWSKPDVPYNFGGDWERFLKDAGAVKWGTTVHGKRVEEWLKSHYEEFQRKPVQTRTMEEGQKYQKTRYAHGCLCNGDRPKFESIAF